MTVQVCKMFFLGGGGGVGYIRWKKIIEATVRQNNKQTNSYNKKSKITKG